MSFILKQKRIAFKVFFSPLKFSYQKSYQSFIHKNAQASQVKVHLNITLPKRHFFLSDISLINISTLYARFIL